MLSKVTEIINEWDPINLLHHAPVDEYEYEINEIIKCMPNIKSVEDLAETIHKIFIKCFSSDVFKRSFDECIEIARKILY